VPVLTGLSPHLRLQSDERLIALVRRGHHGAFEALVKRYHSRLLAFCRHMLGSNEDAEDVLQEVFTASFRAICADEREINVRPWLYRIARNRCLNHLRRPQDAGQESMDVFEREAGATTADTVHRREEFRQVLADVQDLPETQRTALLLREIDALTYEQIAVAMETTVPSVKSLLVRARISLAEASEARHLTCAEVRLELTQAAEGLTKAAAPTRRHVRSCSRCKTFRRELRRTSHALAMVLPVGPLAVAQKLLAAKAAGAKLGGAKLVGAKLGAGAATEGATGGAALFGGGSAGVLSAASGSIAVKAAAGLAAAALVTAGAVEVRRGDAGRDATASAPAQAAVDVRPPPEPLLAAPSPATRPVEHRSPVPAAPEPPEPVTAAEPAPKPDPEPAPVVEEPVVAEPAPVPVEAETEPAPPTDETYEGETTEPTDPAVEPPGEPEPPPDDTGGEPTGAPAPARGSGGSDFPGTTKP